MSFSLRLKSRNLKRGDVLSDRVILHCDCNSFFASVETAIHPEYKDVPMAVCGSVEDRRGIVLAKNELAKKYNIKTAETVFSAKKKCPALVIAKPHHKLYVEYSEKVNDIYKRYTDMVEPFGIDESWLDVTGSKKIFGDGLTIAKKISEDVKREIGITVSIGVSFNKVFAKLGSDYKKPDAITVIDRENFKRIVYPLPVSSLLFVGQKTELQLIQMGIRTIGELAESNPDFVFSKLGKNGQQLHKYALGEDNSPVSSGTDEDSKSISNGITFKRNLISYDEYRTAIDFLSEEIGTKLRQKGVKASTVQITIRDEYFRTIQRQRAQNPPSDIGGEIAKTALDILISEWRVGKPIRMLTVTATGLLKSDMILKQLSIFEESDTEACSKSRNTEKTVDKIRQKYGESAIIKGAALNTDIGIYAAPEESEE